MRLTNNLLEVHYKISEDMKDKLVPLIENLLKAPDEKCFNWWLYLFLDPRYAEDLKEIRELHGVEGVHSKTVIFEMKLLESNSQIRL